MKRIFILLSLLMVLIPSISKCQLNADGKDYYVGLLTPSFMNQDTNLPSVKSVQGYYGVYLLISSYYDNTVTVSYFDNKGNEVFKELLAVKARRSIQVPLNLPLMKMSDSGEVAEYKACHIIAKSAINVQYFSTGACAGGSYLALPTNVLGNSYVVESYHDNPGWGGLLTNENSVGYFMIVGAYDSTTIEITPNTTTLKGKPGVNTGIGSNGKKKPYYINLNRGQCYMVKSSSKDLTTDISGTTILSTKPITVIAGHENAYTDSSSVGNINVEARDYMVEQMMPTVYWDTAGYISIPFYDSKTPALGGNGDEYRIFANTNADATIKMSYDSTKTKIYTSKLFASKIPSATNNSTPVDFYSTTVGGKFHVMMYDQRMQGETQPYPAPSMMTLIPKSRWKSTYLWAVPKDKNALIPTNFINVICRKVDYENDSLLIAMNGGNLVSLRKSSLALKKLWATIPNHSDLIGLTFQVPVATYFATNIAKGDDNNGGVGFTVYSYGFRAVDPSNNLGTNNGDDNYFSYALPVGMLGGAGTVVTSKISVNVDTLCSSWNVCVHARGNDTVGIKQLTILDDSNGDIVRPGHQYHNVLFDPVVDPDNTRELNLSGKDSDYCAKVFVRNIADTAYCPLYVVDNMGNDYLVELHYKGPALTIQNELSFPVTKVGTSECATLYYTNQGNSTVNVKSFRFSPNSVAFTVTKTVPKLPFTLKPHSDLQQDDTLAVTVCFHSRDRLHHADTLLCTTDCYSIHTLCSGDGGSPIISAEDINFGTLELGKKKCLSAGITNLGEFPFTLTKDWILQNKIDFEIESATALALPKVILPGSTFIFGVCFIPTKPGVITTTLDWATDIQLPTDTLNKSTTILTGRVTTRGIIWEKDQLYVYADTTTKPSIGEDHISLENYSLFQLLADSVYISGEDSSEFKLSSNQVYTPLTYFSMNPNARVPVNVEFNPDMSKPQPGRGSLRHATLYAICPLANSRTAKDTIIANLIGGFDKLALVRSKAMKSSETSLTAYQYDRQLIVAIPDGLAGMSTCELYDLLGRKVMSWDNSGAQSSKEHLVLPLPSLSSGMYIVRLKYGSKQLSTTVILRN